MTSRRHLLLALAAAPLLAGHVRAQQAGRTYRLGWIGTTTPKGEPYNVAFSQRLAELGFIEGRNLTVEFRSARVPEQLPALVADVARLRCDAVFAPGTANTLRAVVQGIHDRPIAIVATDYDPVATGAVTTMARPGGRVTGVSLLQTELPAKRLQLLKELLPRLRRAAVMADTASADQLASTRSAASRLGLELVVHDFARPPHDFAQAFATFDKGRAEGLIALGSAFFVPGRQRIPALALQHRMPSVFHNILWAENGGLLSYGPNFTVSYRRAAEMVAKLLNGADPADMPIEQPSEVELVINQKTARALGLVVPPALLTRADRLIE